MNARKIIFLDCDGVINSIQWEVARKDMPSGSVVDDAIDPHTFPTLHHYSRGEEIQSWLDCNDDIYDYIIIDDREDFLSE